MTRQGVARRIGAAHATVHVFSLQGTRIFFTMGACTQYPYIVKTCLRYYYILHTLILEIDVNNTCCFFKLVTQFHSWMKLIDLQVDNVLPTDVLSIFVRLNIGDYIINCTIFIYMHLYHQFSTVGMGKGINYTIPRCLGTSQMFCVIA